ncbi:MAG: hypothetical protein GY832_09330 [Chloroflexi bacterium]|nr:hypothetical protein [Chloroflexota bacterium]
MTNTTHRWIWPTFAGLSMLLALLLWLAPAEQTLGQAVKLVYLHGALVRTAMLIFTIALPVNLVALFRGQENWTAWGKALVWGAAAIWLAHTLFSMITTYVTWGIAIAWFEPRTRFTFGVAGASVICIAAAHLVDHTRFSSLVFVILSGLVMSMLPRLGFIQHPLDPIGTSPSNAIRAFYTAILLVTLILGGILITWFRSKLSIEPV